MNWICRWLHQSRESVDSTAVLRPSLQKSAGKGGIRTGTGGRSPIGSNKAANWMCSPETALQWLALLKEYRLSQETTRRRRWGVRESLVCASMLSLQSCLTLWPHGLQPARLFRLWDFPDKNTGTGCHDLLQESSWPKDRTRVSSIFCIGRQVLYH